MAAEKPKAGRPSLLKDPLRGRILAAIRRGCPYWMAAEANGVSRATMRAWMKTGKEDQAAKRESAFASFLAEVHEADAAGCDRRLEVIEAASLHDWKAAHTINAIRHPEEFASDRQELRRAQKQLAEMAALMTQLIAQQQGSQIPPASPPASGGG